MKIRTALALLAAVAAPLGTGASVLMPATAAVDGRERIGRCAQPGPYQLPQGSDPVRLDPKDFTSRIDHPYWPLLPGATWRYEERGDGEVAKVRVEVTHRTKKIKGVEARVVHDVVSVDGQVVENTWDWYAQDSGGNLWYLGEFTQEFENGELVGTEGTWKHGRDGAYAGVILPARPRPGCGYREEYLEGEAEDRARILSVSEKVKSPVGFHRHVLQTKNTTPLEPRHLENKFYARGVGPMLELDLSPRLGQAVLMEFKPGH